MTPDQIKARIAAMQSELATLAESLQSLLDAPDQDKPEEQPEKPQDNLGNKDDGENTPDETPEEEQDADTDQDNTDTESEEDTDSPAEGSTDPVQPGEGTDAPGEPSDAETDQDSPTEGEGEPSEEISTASDTAALADDDRPADDSTRGNTVTNEAQAQPDEEAQPEEQQQPSPYAGVGATENARNNGANNASDGTAEIIAAINYAPPAEEIAPELRAYWLDQLEYQTRNAQIVPAYSPQISPTYARHNEEAQSNSADLRQYIAANLTVPPRTLDGLETGYRSGELDESELWQIATRIDDPVSFARRTVEHSPELVVGIIVDCSGSMDGGGKMREARALAQAVYDAVQLDKSLPVHVWGFSEGYKTESDAPTPEQRATAKSRFSIIRDEIAKHRAAHEVQTYYDHWLSKAPNPDTVRYEHTLYGNSVLKIFDTVNPDTDTFAPHPLQAGGNNPDGAAILWAARQLRELHPDAQGIVLIQISDGSPARDDIFDVWVGQEWGEMRIAEQTARSLGVHTLHIGVGGAFGMPNIKKHIDAVFHGNHVPVKNFGDAAPAIVAMLQRAISDL